MANTQALAPPAKYLKALHADLAAIRRYESAAGVETSTILVPSSDAIADVGEVVRQLSERSDALLSIGDVDKGTLAAVRSTVAEIPPKHNHGFTKGVSQAASRMPRVSSQVTAYTAPIAVFEGTVRSVDRAAEVMYVTLTSKTRDVSDHAADISFAWVNPQDLDLIAPGAVFYLSLYKERRGGTIRNTEELRFRRMPAWTRTQIARVRDDAERLYSKLQARPLLDE